MNDDDIWDIPIGHASEKEVSEDLIEFLAYLVDHKELEVVTEEWVLQVLSEYIKHKSNVKFNGEKTQ